MSVAGKQGGAHILIFPYPAQGHMVPTLDLTHQLALRGLNLTILVTPKNLPSLNPLLSSHPNSIQTLILPFPSHPSLPPGVENVGDIGNSGNLLIMAALTKLHNPIAHWFHSHPNPPVAIISDFFLGWTQRLARQLGIPRICFYPSGAFFTSIYNHLWQNFDSISLSPAMSFPDLPRSPVISEEHLPTGFRVCKAKKGSAGDLDILLDGMMENISTWGCIFNTFYSLEGEYLEYLKKKTGRVWGIGPLNLMGGIEGKFRVNPDDESVTRVMSWLDECPDGSVLYVCFGSQKVLNKAQMKALASALDLSGVRFIWVAKPPPEDMNNEGYGLVPDGFEDQVVGRGMIIKGWAPQVSILGHQAVGGFLSHCGWNSVLEAIVAGVMILAWPMEADQFIDARLLVEHLEVAVRMTEGRNTVPEPIALAKTIALAMEGDSDAKKRAKELRDEATKAIKVDGSSWNDLENLVKELTQLQSLAKENELVTI
ncbi:UDP-glycosyltransferase 89A2-like [Impatiens glandulifera]|uniref:UDP-glycosyltransferase 89A2-like n=1 Tax=Impatiens glandulifera TaxID=253017 RepID=UPI001FB0D8F0|nr:UDP-glycosyltransferase 89A2-like [Impatiens glandulifera]